HSECQTVTVSIDTVDSDLMMLVADDGRGFDPATINRGMGLDNMTQRSTDAGGSVNIRSQIGAGTTISIRLPA
ncbi:MAG: ATP-binding protein, partial [Acidimicrobiia bacterium]|nr:ATP-binding protein [Acidimicrobiia bacterium]